MKYPFPLNYLGSISVSFVPNKILLIYTRSLSSDVACIHSYSVGKNSVVVLLIYPACTITVGVSSLSFSCCLAVCHWYICTGVASDFITAYFRASMRDIMPCFPGTTLVCLISASCLIIDICYTLCCLKYRDLHTFCILIDLQQPSKHFFNYTYPKSTVEKLLMWPWN